MSGFVLVGTQRSGTTLVRSALGSHPDVLCLGEVFFLNKADRRSGRPAMGKGLSAGFSAWKELSYQSYLEQSMTRRWGHWLFRGHLTRRYLNGLYSTPGYSAVGFKLMANQARKFPAVVPYIEENGIRVVHILRENPFDILLSRLSMKARGYAHSTSRTNDAVTVYVPLDRLVAELRSIRNEGLHWKELFENRSPYLLMTYERFVQNRDAASSDLLSFLGVDASVQLRSELTKLNTLPASELVQNFDEVKACIEHSEFSWCVS